MNRAADSNDGLCPDSRRSGSIILLLTILTLLAAGLRFHRLGGHGLWLDEAHTVLFATMPARGFWKLMWRQEGNMLLYYLLLRGWVHVGDTEFILRVPSVLFAAASIPMIYLVGRDLFCKSTGIIAAALLTAHWFHIFFSQQARSYTLLLFLLLTSSWLFVRFTESPERRLYQFSYPVVSALSMYAHLFAILVVASHWLSLGRVRARRVGWRRSLGMVAAFFVLALPMEAFALLRNRGQLNWIPPLTLKGFGEAMSQIAGYDNGSLGVLMLTLGLAVIAVAVDSRSRSEPTAFSVRFVAVWAVLPIALTLLYSIHKPLFYSRFFVICVPALLLLVAEGVVAVKRLATPLRWLWLPALALMLGMSLRASWHYFKAPIWPDWRSATHLVLVNQLPGDGVCFAGNGVEPFLYYLHREMKIGWDSLPDVQHHQGFKCISHFPGEVSETPSRYQRVWLITTDPNPQERSWIKENLVPLYGRPIQRGVFAGSIKIELLPGAAG